MAIDANGRGVGDGVDGLRRDLAEAKAQLAATSEVLTALGRSASDLDAILGTVVGWAQRLCRADVAQIHLVDGDVLTLARSTGLSDEGVAYLARHPVGKDRTSMIGRVALYAQTQQITDVLTDPDYRSVDFQRLTGLRTIVGVPMVLDGDLAGVLLVWRTEVEPFGDREIEVLTTFAAQATIAIRQVALLRTLEARQQELAQKIEQLEALGEVGEAVSSSLDLDEVLATIVAHAVQLSGTDGGSIFEFDETESEFRVRTAYGTSDELLERLRRIHIGRAGTLVGRAATEGRVLQVSDLRQVPLDPHLQCLHEAGWQSLVAVPMLREGRIVGALVVRRRRPGGFSEETCDLLETFASQSCLAILNARLFGELERKSAELEIASRHKSEFLASMSHELRTPLNAVIGFSEVLLEHMFGDLNERQDEYVRDIWSSGKHLLDLLNDILDLSKVEAGRMDLEWSTFSVREALENGLALMRERAARKSINLNLEIAPEIGLMHADELRFKQVMLNLLSNAVKFTPEAGAVVVRATSDGSEVSVTVTDSGIGVASADQTRIFESFQQGGRGAQHQEGTGLGLTLCRRIIGLLGGRMWLESDVGKGSTFGFVLPLGSPESAQVPRPDESDESAPRGGPLVVVIEDDRRSLDLLRLYLRRAGVEVVGVRDGATGLEVVRQKRPSAVVLDIRLPGMDGWDVLATLKSDPATAPIPVVVVSMVDERGRGFALGAAEYLVKPVSRDDFLSALGRIIALPDSNRSLLAIDDDPLVIEFVKAALVPEGWQVLSASDGETGVALARSRQPAVVLLDLLMPGMDGFEIAAALHDDLTTRQIPIIVLTSMTMTRADKERLQGRISHVAQKGTFDPALLVALVHRTTKAPAASSQEGR